MGSIIAMGEGNPGAITVMARLVKANPLIDPDCAFGDWGALISLDALDIYGSRIWMLYKDVCKESLGNTLAVMRAVQLGFLKQRDLDSAIDGKSKLDVAALLAQVKERLPAFNEQAAI